MILWTIQSKKAYESLCENGVLIASKNHAIFEPAFESAYKWLADQMKIRIGVPPEGVIYPIWAWYQWEGKRKRPDMRSHNVTDTPGETIVLLTIDVPEDEVLLSDFDLWHFVLMGACIEDEISDREYSKDEIIESWNKIFDYENPVCGDGPLGLSTQATMWQVKKEWVKKAEFFKAR